MAETVDARVIVVLVIGGLLAYAAQVPWLILLRLSLGRTRGEPIPQLLGMLLDDLLSLLLLMTLAFGLSSWSLMRAILSGTNDRDSSVLGLLLTLMFVITPIWINVRLWHWRWKHTRPGTGIAEVATGAVQTPAPETWDGTERRGQP